MDLKTDIFFVTEEKTENSVNSVSASVRSSVHRILCPPLDGPVDMGGAS